MHAAVPEWNRLDGDDGQYPFGKFGAAAQGAK
jgi:hypothetical protein